MDELANIIKKLGSEKVVLATDLGQPENVDPVSGMKELIHQLLSQGIIQKEIDTMTKTNPVYL